MADVKTEVTVDIGSVYRTIYKMPGMREALGERAATIAATANALGSGYRTPKWHDHETGETRGGTAPVYAGEAGRKCIGIVHPANYAAMKDNYLHNTMLKAKG